MEEQLISFETAKSAKEKGFYYTRYIDLGLLGNIVEYYDKDGRLNGDTNFCTECCVPEEDYEGYIAVSTQSFLQKWIRETRGVNIQIYNNASGYLFAMAECEGGTDLGWSEYSGPNSSGVWDTYEEALEFALLVQLGTDLEKFGHWGNYVENAIKIWKDT